MTDILEPTQYSSSHIEFIIRTTCLAIRTLCLDSEGKKVHRYLGMPIERCEKHNPAWVPEDWAVKTFDSLNRAKEAAKTPHAYSVRNGSYLLGSPVEIVKITHTTTTIITRKIEP